MHKPFQILLWIRGAVVLLRLDRNKADNDEIRQRRERLLFYLSLMTHYGYEVPDSVFAGCGYYRVERCGDYGAAGVVSSAAVQHYTGQGREL